MQRGVPPEPDRPPVLSTPGEEDIARASVTASSPSSRASRHRSQRLGGTAPVVSHRPKRF
jgi:hypothetical protein